MSLVVDHVTFNYGSLCALEDVSAEATPGRIAALIGPNAAGKSTLLRCAIDALRPIRGRVVLDGRPVNRMSPRALAAKIAYVPQRSTVAAAFTVREVVALGRYALPSDRGRVDDALARLDLMDLADRPYPRLSVGQQQRVTLARALAQLSPEGCLILDEPTSAMDLEHVRCVIRILRSLAREGATVVAAMHDLALASAMANDVWILSGGRLVASGPAAEVMEPQRLASIFKVGFRRIEDGHGGAHLLADISGGEPPLE